MVGGRPARWPLPFSDRDRPAPDSRALSSAVERFVYTEDAGGSNPSAPMRAAHLVCPFACPNPCACPMISPACREGVRCVLAEATGLRAKVGKMGIAAVLAAAVGGCVQQGTAS